MPNLSSLRRLLRGEDIFRFVDAFSPRVFGLAFHSVIVVGFGAELYAFPAWLFGLSGLLAGIIPDPHGYILARRTGSAARRLIGLAMPWVAAKIILVNAVAVLAALWLTSPALRAPHAAVLAKLIAAALFFSTTEQFWQVVGFTAYAAGNLKRVALAGLAVRAGGLILSLVLFRWNNDLSLCLFAFSAPQALAVACFLRWNFNLKRVTVFGLVAFRSYTIWTQLIGMVIGFIAQSGPLLLGGSSRISAQMVGQFAFFMRAINAAVQPFQILQSVVIHSVVGGAGAGPGRRPSHKKLFRWGALVVLAAGAVVTGWLAHDQGLGLENVIAYGLITLGIFVFTQHRYEMALLFARREVRFLFVQIFVPVGLAFLAALAVWQAFQTLLALALLWSGLWVLCAGLIRVRAGRVMG